MKKPSASRPPKSSIAPRTGTRGDRVELRGERFLDCAVRIAIDGRPAIDIRVVRGFAVPGGVRPDGDGEFFVFIGTLALSAGRHELTLSTRFGGKRFNITHTLRVTARRNDDHADVDELPFDRTAELFRRRFGHLGYIPQGILSARAASLERDHGKVVPYNKIITPGCNWTVLGPSPGISAATPSFLPLSGKVRALAIDPTNTQIVYAGGAVGGVWKTTDGGATWLPKSDYQSSLAIGALAIDPHNASHIYAGTGVYPDDGYLDYFGNGLLVSTDGGTTWTERATATFQRQAISQIRFDPTDATSMHLFLSASNGVYESTDGGVNWTQLYTGDSGGLAVLVVNGNVTVIAAIRFHGLYTSSLISGAWQTWTQISSNAFASPVQCVVLGQSPTVPATMYVGMEGGPGPDDLGSISKSTDGGVTWTACNKPPSQSSQLWHAFQLAVHPTDSNTVYYGEINVWKTIDGGQTWVGASNGIHGDQNAFAIDPTNPNVVWAGNDGGVWRTSDGTATWEPRNAGLALSKCIQLAQHPTWDSVLLVTSQDNGTYRYQGQAAWERVGAGDTGPAGIDPTQPTTMFLGAQNVSVWRSDSAGAPGTWVNKTGALSGDSLFYAPFLTDPNGGGVCYFGGGSLWRSPDRGDNWTAVTAVLDAALDPMVGRPYAISGIAVYPGNADRVFVCSSHGRVYSVERTGVDWTPANVTVIDVTGTGLPANASLSDIAVDSNGTLWVTVSSILMPLLENQFTNDHVYRLTSGSTAWQSRSTGLAVANPVNSIVIDPLDDDVLYCGCDVGVFKTTDGGGSWVPWDDGLPNAPVVDLVLHQNRRLLRAATFGRSVWERPLDVTMCPSVDLYLRDNIVDTGRVQPTPSNVSDPFDPATLDWWWQSEDIKVDGPSPGFQTPTPIADYVSFEQRIVHTSPRRGVSNRFYVQLQNRGPRPATGIQVRAFFADAHAGLPALPNDFWLNGSPFTADPSASTYVPVGPTRTVGIIHPGRPEIVEWDFTVPMSAPDHSCLIVFATCNENVLNGAGSLDPGWLVPNSKQITLKNLHVVDAVVPSPAPRPKMMTLRLHNARPKDARYDVDIHWGTLPAGTVLEAAFERLPDGPVMGEKKRGGVTVSSRRGPFPASIEDHCGDAIPIDRSRVYRVERRDKASVLAGIRVPAGSSLVMLLNVTLPDRAKTRSYRFDVVQRSGKEVVGGSTYEISNGRTDR